ncbi:hypothetical protein BB8028_0006g07860 [Beauveria bassiana]|uniref:Uncharacterized protein n=1 Tax=Beauveria bassiana TaxID=176275 RepID=A0A2S7YJX1_BEABA|nr:hypothetical protein BB8028_0006g07860 [Beauveria bassiana]
MRHHSLSTPNHRKNGQESQESSDPRAPPLHGHDGLLLHVQAPAHGAANGTAEIRSDCAQEGPLSRI